MAGTGTGGTENGAALAAAAGSSARRRGEVRGWEGRGNDSSDHGALQGVWGPQPARSGQGEPSRNNCGRSRLVNVRKWPTP